MFEAKVSILARAIQKQEIKLHQQIASTRPLDESLGFAAPKEGEVGWAWNHMVEDGGFHIGVVQELHES